jgi:ATP phosphoribosyltransferase regulatory subunit
MLRWLLPESIEDVLPHEAGQIERMRRALLDLYERAGYQLVQPPLLEYLESLSPRSAPDLDLRTFKVVDQISGRMMGLRADITPQVARIDAHLLNRRGVARLCYCHSVLHTLPGSLTATREPMQIGAELYGHAGLEADCEVIRLMADSLQSVGAPAMRIDIGHVGIFRALTKGAGLDVAAEETIFELLQAKDTPTLSSTLAHLPESSRSGLLALPALYGGLEVLDEAAARLPKLPEITAAIDDVRRLAVAMSDLPLSIDLADLRGYHYHSGVVFAAYSDHHPAAVALGGRYDNIGQAFGRSRPATGFSLDLRELARLAPRPAAKGAILAPRETDPSLVAAIDALRQTGEIVMIELPGHEGTWQQAGCDRRLIHTAAGWHVSTL